MFLAFLVSPLFSTRPKHLVFLCTKSFQSRNLTNQGPLGAAGAGAAAAAGGLARALAAAPRGTAGEERPGHQVSQQWVPLSLPFFGFLGSS